MRHQNHFTIKTKTQTVQKVNNRPLELEKDFKPVKKYLQMIWINLNKQMNREDNVC